MAQARPTEVVEAEPGALVAVRLSRPLAVQVPQVALLQVAAAAARTEAEPVPQALVARLVRQAAVQAELVRLLVQPSPVQSAPSGALLKVRVVVAVASLSVLLGQVVSTVVEAVVQQAERLALALRA